MECDPPKVRSTITANEKNVTVVCFFPHRTRLCSGGFGGSVVLTNFEEEDLPFKNLNTGNANTVWGCDFSPDGSLVCVGSSGNKISFFNLENFESENEIGVSCVLSGPERTCIVRCVRFFRNDPNILATSGDDSAIRTWDIEKKKEICVFQEIDETRTLMMFSVDISPDHTTIASGDSNNELKLWDIRSRTSTLTFSHHKNWIRSVQFNPVHPQFIASGSYDHTVKIVDIRKPDNVLKDLKKHDSSVRTICFHHTGDYLISGSADRKVIIYDHPCHSETKVNEKEVLFESSALHSDTVRCVQFSSDGCLFASGSDDTKVLLWDFPLGRLTSLRNRDIDEEERIQYLVDQDLHADEKRNVVKISTCDVEFRFYKIFFFV